MDRFQLALRRRDGGRRSSVRNLPDGWSSPTTIRLFACVRSAVARRSPSAFSGTWERQKLDRVDFPNPNSSKASDYVAGKLLRAAAGAHSPEWCRAFPFCRPPFGQAAALGGEEEREVVIDELVQNERQMGC